MPTPEQIKAMSKELSELFEDNGINVEFSYDVFLKDVDGIVHDVMVLSEKTGQEPT